MMNVWRRISEFSVVAAAALCLSPGPVFGAAHSPWTYFDKTRGLAENTVQAIVPDGAGGLWVGTRGGLSHFDGAAWETTTVADGLPDNDVHSLAPEGPGRLWVGAGSGFGRIEGGRWSRLGLPGAATGVRGRVVVVTDRAGVTWLGHAGGMLRYDRAAGVLEPVPEVAGQPVGALLVDREGRFWAGVGGDLWLRDETGWQRVKEADGLPSGAVTVLFEDPAGTVWCGGERGVAEFDGSSWRPARLGAETPAVAVTAMAQDGEGRVWVGTSAGAGFTDGYEWHWFTASSGLPADGVLALAADRNGSIWIGTTRGLARFDTTWSVPAVAGREGVSPRAPLLLGRDGSLFVGAEQGFVVQRGRIVETVGPRERLEGRVRCFAEDAEGDLWVGTDRGLARYDGTVREHFVAAVNTVYVERSWGATEAQKTVVCDLRNGLTDDVVTALAADAEGGVWVGTTRGLSRLQAKEWTCPADPSEEGGDLFPGPVTSLATDRRGRLWVGTPKGLWMLEEGAWRRQRTDDGLAADAVTALLVDRDDRLWVGTERGVSRREGESWATFGTRQGLVSARVLALFEDARGRIWIGTQEGVSFFDQGLWGAFGEQDGLPSTRIAAIAEFDGRIWFGAEEGLGVHRPDHSPPVTRIVNPPSGPVAAPSYYFELAGGDLETQPRRLRYSWRIDGGPWTAWSPEPQARVTDLVNGSHLFEARCLDAELNADPTPAAVTFEVNTGLFDVELVDAAFGPLYASLYQFYASDPDFARRPAGQVSIRNRYDRELRVKVSVFLPDLMDFPTDAVASVPPGETVRVPLRIELSDRALDLERTESRQLRLTLQYNLAGERKESESTHAVTVIEKHGMVWEEPERVGLYVTHLDEAVERFARDTVRGFRELERGAIVYDNLLRAMELFDALAARGVRYVPDPENAYSGIIPDRAVLDTVRLPRETLRLRTGDCDDLAMLYAALLQNIGIDTAVVDLFDHVLVMFDTGLTKRSIAQLARDPGLLQVDGQGRVWVPVEVTMVGGSFSDAWEAAATTLASRRHAVIEIKEAWKKYAPLRPRAPAPDIVAPPLAAVRALFTEDLRRQEEALTSPRMRALAQRIAGDPQDAAALNALGILLARRGYLGRAAAHFERVIELLPDFAGGYGNLGNVMYEQGKYPEAVRRYEEGLARADLPEVHVELALTWCEIGKFDRAREHYRRAMRIDESLAPEPAGASAGDHGREGAMSP
ncbi:MAG: two-component regulator propeller domain-containing protein [Candidatus Methylomirabilia bacterium]